MIILATPMSTAFSSSSASRSARTFRGCDGHSSEPPVPAEACFSRLGSIPEALQPAPNPPPKAPTPEASHWHSKSLPLTTLPPAPGARHKPAPPLQPLAPDSMLLWPKLPCP